MTHRPFLPVAMAFACLATAFAAASAQVDTRYYDAQSNIAAEYRAAKPTFDADVKAALAAADAPRHLPYAQASYENMTTLSPRSGYVIKRCDLLPEAEVAMVALVKAANADSANKDYRLYAASCFRSIDEQVPVFCNRRLGPTTDCLPLAARIRESAPPGFSEHATGYTIDFIVRRRGDTDDNNICTRAKPADKEPCGAEMDTVTGHWLANNAVGKGFELSFPCAEFAPTGLNPACVRTMQGVMYEPWHWRWVGTTKKLTDQARIARKVFATARKCFQADPFIAPAPGALDTDQPITCPPPLPR